MTHPQSDSIGWNPSPTDRILLAGDETAIPVIRTILATLRAKDRGQVFIEVDYVEDIEPLQAPGRFAICWLVRSHGQSLQRSVNAWLSEMLPDAGLDDEASVYAWIAGSGAPRALSAN